MWTREVCSKDPEEVQDGDWKAMNIPMASNLKLLSVASSELFGAMMYRQMNCSLMYLTNTRPDICFAMNTSPDGSKAWSEVPEGYS